MSKEGNRGRIMKNITAIVQHNLLFYMCAMTSHTNRRGNIPFDFLTKAVTSDADVPVVSCQIPRSTSFYC